MSTNTDLLARLPLLRGLSPGELATLTPRFREDHYDRDAHIFYEGDPAARFWVVKAGQVKIVKAGESGKEVVIEVIPPGEAFGGATMLMPNQPATAQALSDLLTLSLSVAEYKQLLQDYPIVGVHVIEMLGERMRGLVRMRSMAGERVERRIAHILLKLARKFGQAHPEGWMIQASLTREDIAELADTTIETAIRVMSRFRKEGLVKTLRGGYIVILDREALQNLSGSAPPGD